MNKIRLYKIKSRESRFINEKRTEDEPKNIYNRIGTIAAKGAGGGVLKRGEPLFPNALPRDIVEIARDEQRGCGGVDGNDSHQCVFMVEEIPHGRIQGVTHQARARAKTNHGQHRRGSRACRNSGRPTACEQGTPGMAGGNGQESWRYDLQAFFKRIGARYKPVRKRPKGKSSPQLYAYKREKLQGLERLSVQGSIDLCYGDESHVCTEGYVPYAWQFKGEDVHVPTQRAARLNIFGMVCRYNIYHGFTTHANIGSVQVVDFLDRFSFTVREKTVIVLDNVSIHRSKQTTELRKVWEQRGLFLFFLPPYSLHLNIIETLWRILKTKWLRPQDYVSADQLFYSTNRALTAVGNGVNVKYAHIA